MANRPSEFHTLTNYRSTESLPFDPLPDETWV